MVIWDREQTKPSEFGRNFRKKLLNKQKAYVYEYIKKVEEIWIKNTDLTFPMMVLDYCEWFEGTSGKIAKGLKNTEFLL